MIFLIKVTIFISVLVSWDKVKCIPRYRIKNIEKTFHFVSPLPVKHFTFLLEKVTPFAKYELKHVIHKRQISQSELLPVANEIPVTNIVAIEDIAKLPEDQIIEKKVEEHIPEVIITSIIKPIENSKSFSFVLPEEPEVFIRPADKGAEVLKEPVSEVPIIAEPIAKPEEVVPPPEPVIEITPKPLVVLPPSEPRPAVQNVDIKSPIESTMPFRVPLFSNSNGPIPSPVVNNIPNLPLLYTDISQIPLSGAPYPTPIAIPNPEVIVPRPLPPPPPVPEPPVVKEPPILKEETPNFFVKGSRFVLYFGSMMLQMLSQLVNGRINLNQPLPLVLPGLQ